MRIVKRNGILSLAFILAILPVSGFRACTKGKVERSLTQVGLDLLAGVRAAGETSKAFADNHVISLEEHQRLIARLDRANSLIGRFNRQLDAAPDVDYAQAQNLLGLVGTLQAEFADASQRDLLGFNERAKRQILQFVTVGLAITNGLRIVLATIKPQAPAVPKEKIIVRSDL